MSLSPYTIVIPARYGSSRFPGKPLHKLNKHPMILHTVARARESGANEIIVATDDQRIAAVCKEAGVDTQMTQATHPSGTDRIAEVARVREWDHQRLIVGLQGDEPATPPDHLDGLARNLQAMPDADMATLCMAIGNVDDYSNPHRVKVVRDHRNMALYFSRASIPARRDLDVETGNGSKNFPASCLHIGLYAYRCRFLLDYHAMDTCTLEQEEQLEQLRVLYYGGKIHVGEVRTSNANGVDHPDDVPALEDLLARDYNPPA